ncbi:lysophospholipid acyltransferase family protein [Brevibacterium yomogidense]|uniref:hypothetical protein n=1 Tax=Brevibacterium yomogidense TaxID=946573 RepID=UPI0018DF5875|nr:hypothetical protein [Brevibacterium yomogidense]
MTEAVTMADVRPPRSAALGPWYRTVLAGMRRAVFGPVRRGGTDPGPRTRPRLILASHRNGAADGPVVLSAFPYAQHLVSMQLLRGPLRALFTGIPVIRSKDVERYGMDRSSITDPVTAAVEHLSAGGDLVIFPEGTSEWRHAPGTYQRGAAKIWCRLRDAGVDVDVLPVGLFYAAPERYCSLAELWVGPAVDLPDTVDGPRTSREEHAHALLTDALDAVSVNCPDPLTFDRVQRRATARARAGEPFAAAFLDEQRATAAAGLTPAEPGPREQTSAGSAPAQRGPREQTTAAEAPIGPWPRRLGLALHWPVAPVLWAAAWVGRKADARNTVTFYRMLGGSGAAVGWALVLVVTGVWATLAGTRAGTGAGATVAAVAGAGLLSLVAGRAIVRARRWQPDTAPLT